MKLHEMLAETTAELRALPNDQIPSATYYLFKECRNQIRAAFETGGLENVTGFNNAMSLLCSAIKRHGIPDDLDDVLKTGAQTLEAARLNTEKP